MLSTTIHVLVNMIHIWYTYDTCYTCILNESFTMRPSRLWYVNDTWQYDVFLRRSPWVSFCSLVTPRYGIINVSAVYQVVYQVPILNNRPEDTSTAPCMPASAAWWHHDTYYTRIYNVLHCIITDPAVSDVIHVSLMYQLRITNMIHVRYMAQLYSMHIDGIIWYQLCIMCVFCFMYMIHSWYIVIHVKYKVVKHEATERAWYAVWYMFDNSW